MGRLSTRAPAARQIPSADDLRARLTLMLSQDYCLKPLSEYSIVVEGQTDVRYLKHAAALAQSQFGEDLLSVPEGARNTGASEIMICSPGKPGMPHRGGIPQMVRLARDLQTYVFTLDMFGGIVFVFDHDDEGQKGGRDKVQEYGFTTNAHCLTLDPKVHINACSRKQVVVEDLLSRSIQGKFFGLGNSWCSACYEAGDLVRYHWENASKANLCDFACGDGSWLDFREIGRVLGRVRQLLGFPVNNAIFDCVGTTTAAGLHALTRSRRFVTNGMWRRIGKPVGGLRRHRDHRIWKARAPRRGI